MLALLSEVFSWLAHRCRGRAALELEVIALRHQLAVLRRQRPERPRLFSIDRLLWVWLYRVWPRCLDVMVLVKPATVVQWHRRGFRLYRRWRSRSGRPSINREIRGLIRQMSMANPLWGAPRIHGELLKLGIEISQATVAKYMIRRPGSPSPTWRSFLRNQALGIAAIDMFVVPVGSISIFVCSSDPDSRPSQAGPLQCHPKSHRGMAFTPGNGSVPVGCGTAIPAARPRWFVRFRIQEADRGDGNR